MKNKEQICDLFRKKHTANLRILKCGLQDFLRVYRVYSDMEYMDKIDATLISFLIYSLECKAGHVLKSQSDSELFKENDIDDYYQGIYQKDLLPETVKEWVSAGKWSENALKDEIEKEKRKNESMPPKEQVKYFYLLDLTEDVINEGFGPFLQDAYNGNIELNNYILLIQNLSLAREIGYKFPQTVDYTRLEEGLEQCIERIEQMDATYDNAKVRRTIEDITALSLEEKELYQRIQDYYTKEQGMHNVNKKKYIKALRNHDSQELFKCQNKQYGAFDADMAEAVFEYYERLPSPERRYFIRDFGETWSGHAYSPDFSIEETKRAFHELHDKIASRQRASAIERHIDLLFKEKLDSLIQSYDVRQVAIE